MSNFTKLFVFSLMLISIPLIVFSKDGKGKGMTSKEYNLSYLSSQEIQHKESWESNNRSEDHKHPEFGRLPFNAPNREVVEVLEKRTETERYFVDVNNPGSFHVQKFFKPAHYFEDNLWKTIEYYLEEKEPLIYQSKFYFEPSGFDLNVEESYIQTIHGKVSFNKWLLFKKVNNTKVFLADANWDNYTIGDEGMYITNIFDGIDAEMKINKGSVKTNFIIKNNNYGQFDELIFRDEFAGSEKLQLAFKGGQEAKELVNSILIKNGQEALLEMGEGFAFVQNSSKENSISLAYAIEDQFVDVIVPFFWINEHIDNHYLVVDPLVSGVGTLAQNLILGSMYNSSCNWTNSCDYDLDVTFPANATITDVAVSFSYTAQGACVRYNGAMRFLSGTCISPGASSYWTCDVPPAISTPGVCQADDMSIYDLLGSCMPDPSCLPQDIPFVLQFFRECQGPTGCDNSCIGASSDFSVTVSGNTLEFNLPTSSITLSESSLCEGSSLTASSLGNYGVPPYTYNWSLSSNGTPSLGASATEVITFPEAGNQYLFLFITDDCDNTIKDSVLVEVIPNEEPVFEQIGPLCLNDPLILPMTSDNGVAGYWTTPLNTGSVGVFDHVFVPYQGAGCIGHYTMTIEVLGTATGVEEATICPGESYVFNGREYASRNSTATQTYTSQYGCDSIVTLNLKVSPFAKNISIDSVSCVPITFNGETYMENFTATDTLPNQFGCDSIYRKIAYNIQDFTLKLTASLNEVQEGEPVRLFTKSNQGYSIISWQPKELFYHQNYSDQSYRADQTRTITVLGQNDFGCRALDSIRIEVTPLLTDVFIPNAFSPNGDGLNDEFGPDLMTSRGYSIAEFKVFNRIGQEVFYNKGQLNKKWDGTFAGEPCEIGTYYYSVIIKFTNGKTFEQKGDLHLIR